MKEVTITLSYEFDNGDVERFTEIFNALIRSGGLSGVKNGRTILHFDYEGTFQGVELNYWPWRKRKERR